MARLSRTADNLERACPSTCAIITALPETIATVIATVPPMCINLAISATMTGKAFGYFLVSDVDKIPLSYVIGTSIPAVAFIRFCNDGSWLHTCISLLLMLASLVTCKIMAARQTT